MIDTRTGKCTRWLVSLMFEKIVGFHGWMVSKKILLHGLRNWRAVAFDRLNWQNLLEEPRTQWWVVAPIKEEVWPRDPTWWKKKLFNLLLWYWFLLNFLYFPPFLPPKFLFHTPQVDVLILSIHQLSVELFRKVDCS